MPSALRASTLLLACALCGALGGAHARAQSCHAPLGRVELEGWAASLLLREATVDEPGDDASYQGVVLGVGYGAPRYELSALLPVHRVDSAQGSHVGLSDAVLDARGALLVTHDRTGPVRTPFVLGLELAASLPTGSHERRLGMGHVMLMPGVYARARDPRATLLVQAGYARALESADSGHAAGHAHAQGSLVDPMNASELTAALSLSLSIAQAFALLGSVAAASPVVTSGGVARAALGVGTSWHLAPLQLTAKLELPVLGAAFEQRVTLGITLTP